MIRKATLEDLNKLLIITKSCAKVMAAKQIFQWNDNYPNKSSFENDIKNKCLYVKIKTGEVIGCICVSNFMDEEYLSVKWLTKGNNIYIHRLAVNPVNQKMGYAQEMMSFAEDYAKKNNYNSIRLDTFSKNINNQKFYEQRGYQRLGNVFFPDQSQDPFYCYELVL